MINATRPVAPLTGRKLLIISRPRLKSGAINTEPRRGSTPHYQTNKRRERQNSSLADNHINTESDEASLCFNRRTNSSSNGLSTSLAGISYMPR